jgi:hypothetical protein
MTKALKSFPNSGLMFVTRTIDLKTKYISYNVSKLHRCIVHRRLSAYCPRHALLTIGYCPRMSELVRETDWVGTLLS